MPLKPYYIGLLSQNYEKEVRYRDYDFGPKIRPKISKAFKTNFLPSFFFSVLLAFCLLEFVALLRFPYKAV